MAPRKKLAGADAKQKKPLTEKQQKGPLPPWSKYKEDYARIARVMCENGARDSELADAFEVTTQTIWDWQSRHKEFGKALKVGKGEYDDRVERALAQRAIGYSYDTEKIFMPPGSKEETRVLYREHVPPDPQAAFRWLSCRRMSEWRDRKELTGADGAPLVPILNLTYSNGESSDGSSGNQPLATPETS